SRPNAPRRPDPDTLEERTVHPGTHQQMRLSPRKPLPVTFPGETRGVPPVPLVEVDPGRVSTGDRPTIPGRLEREARPAPRCEQRYAPRPPRRAIRRQRAHRNRRTTQFLTR